MNYTKGEWEKHGNSIQVFQRGCVCTAPKPQNGGVIERMDNLNLIAAAPNQNKALFEVLELVQELLPTSGDIIEFRHKVLNIIRPALTKAEGGK